MLNEREKFLEIFEKYKMPTPINDEDMANKTIDYVTEDFETCIIVFKDNTCRYLWTEYEANGIRTEDSIIDIAVEYAGVYMEQFKQHFPEAYEEWDEYKQEERKARQYEQQKLRYKQYLILKKEFEGQ